MTTRPQDLRKSDFLTVQSLQAGDFFDFIRSGQNLKIVLADLLTSLGVTGSLQALGEATAIPVLSIIGDVNYIRNILGGSGIVASLSPLNGIQLDHSFTVDNNGVELMINKTSSSPIFRSIIGGTGINVSGSGNTIQISNTEVPESTKTVVVYSINDFPAPSAGTITLEANTEYKIQNDISSANNFVFGNGTVLSGADGSLITLGYTGIGTMFTGTDVNIKIKEIILNCPSGTLFNVSSSTGLHLFRYYTGSATCTNVGSFDGLYVVYLFNVVFNITGDGFSFANNITILLMDTLSITIPSGTGDGIDLGTAVFASVTIAQTLFNISTSGYVLKGAAASANISAGGLGAVTNTKNFGSSTFSDNISAYDNRWEMQLNSNIINSFDLVLATHAASTIAISGIATPVILGATWVVEDSHRFSSSVGGRFTYTGKGTHVEVNASISADIVTASDNISFFVYLNGVQITESRMTRLFSAGSIGNLVLFWSLELATNDYIEIWLQNDDTTVDVNISKAILRIRS